MYYLGYVLIPLTNLDSLIWHDFQHLFHFWQIEYWVREDSCKVEYWDLADLHHGIEPNLREKSCFFKYCFSSFVGKMAKGPFNYYVITFLTFLGPPTSLMITVL